MRPVMLEDLQASVRDRSAFTSLSDYVALASAYLQLIEQLKPTRIISPTDHRYIFYQYGETHRYRIARPLNTRLFLESPPAFSAVAERFSVFLSDLRRWQGRLPDSARIREYLGTAQINQFVYTAQQCIGCIADSFEDANQSRKRVGQLFEKLVTLILQEVGIHCESRTIALPIPDYPDYTMSYELDMVFAREHAIIASETRVIEPQEVVGSVKTTSKDRIDKVFLDKYLLSQLLQREIPVIAIFLHDVQRARRGNSIFGIASTFKSNHFLGYTMALNRLDGVYYVDPRPEMLTNPRLNEQIADFQTFLIHDLWSLTDR